MDPRLRGDDGFYDCDYVCAAFCDILFREDDGSNDSGV
jgi:hypothetical protein